MIEEQLLLFEEPREQKLERKIQLLEELCERMRKSQYAKISEVKKEVYDVKNELEHLKLAICRGEVKY